LYTWGWNNQGQLGQLNIENVAAVPLLIDFKNELQKIIERHVNKVQCGSTFTICKTGNFDHNFNKLFAFKVLSIVIKNYIK
jgi:alpha-tubulin suppressor-like RCC1 family protein